MRTDRSLARRAAAGDKTAFEAIYRRYHQEIYRYCRAIVRSEDDARDALQSTMAAALRSLPGDRRDIALKPWLYRVAHNEAISILRAREPLIDPMQAPEGQAAGPEQELGRRERLRRLVADLKDLPNRQRSAVVMRELSGLSFAEIAAALRTTEATARQTLYEARTSLAEMEEGRNLDCVEVGQAISDGDGRRLRGRRLRAHLRSCERCSAYAVAIRTREADLRALCPPLPAAAGASVLGAVLASHGVGASTGAGLGSAAASAASAGSVAGGSGLAGGGLAASGAVKAASVLAAVAVGAGAADATGVVELPLVHSGGGPATQTSPPGRTTTTTQPSSEDALTQTTSGGEIPTGKRTQNGKGERRFAESPGRHVANGHHEAAAANRGSSSGGQTAGRSGEAHESGSNASTNGAEHSSQAGSHTQGQGNGGGSAHSNGNGPSASSNAGSNSNAEGSDRSTEAPGHTKPTGSPASPSSHGNSESDTASTARGNGNGNGRG